MLGVNSGQASEVQLLSLCAKGCLAAAAAAAAVSSSPRHTWTEKQSAAEHGCLQRAWGLTGRGPVVQCQVCQHSSHRSSSNNRSCPKQGSCMTTSACFLLHSAAAVCVVVWPTSMNAPVMVDVGDETDPLEVSCSTAL